MLLNKFGESMHPEFGAALFTLEGIILDGFHLRLEAWKKIFGESGVPFEEEWEERVAEGDQDRLLELISENGSHSLSEEEKQRLLERQNQYYEQSIQEAAPRDLQSGIGPLLKILKKNGVKIALVSVRRNAADIIEQLEIGDFFDVILDADDFDSEVPASEKFLTAADQLRENYKQCVVIESADEGISVSGKIKMPVVVVGGGKSEGAAWVVDNTSEVTYEGLKELFHKKRK